MTSEVTRSTEDDLRGALVTVQSQLSALQGELAQLPDRLKAAAREAARTGLTDEVKELQAQQLILPERITLLEVEADRLVCALEDREIAQARQEAEALVPVREEAERAFRAAREAFEQATAAHQNALIRVTAAEDNRARRRQRARAALR